MESNIINVLPDMLVMSQRFFVTIVSSSGQSCHYGYSSGANVLGNQGCPLEYL